MEGGREPSVELAVLAKVVPDSESVGFDPVRRTTRRDAGPLFLNPFDQRALRVAIELRRPGEHVTVVSMGPPSTESAVRETMALGADRAVLISDPALAGSDTLVTARVLARALESIGADLVLVGKRSTDSDTGQVPAQLAGLLHLPLVSAARTLVRSPPGTEFEAIVETERGWGRVAFSTPGLVSVGEKIAKPLKLGDAPAPAASPRDLERIDAAGLGLSAEEVGAAGSPTTVERLTDRSPQRRGQLFDEGSVDLRVAAALVALHDRLAATGTARPAEIPGRAAIPEREIAVLVTDDEGVLDPASLGTVSEVRRSVTSARCLALSVGPDLGGPEAERLAEAGAEGLLALPASGGWTARTAAESIALALAGRREVSGALFPASPYGREVAGRVSAILGLGLTGDAIGLREAGPGEIVFEKPSFGGGIVAEIRTRTVPTLATVRSGVFELGRSTSPTPLAVEAGPTVAPDPSVRWLERRPDPDDGLPDPDRAAVVISVGTGASTPEALAEVHRLARSWGAAIVGSRRVVDAGVLPVSRQAGLTGRSLAPVLGILVGVRGSPNHMIAWRRAGALLAVNSDRSAPVFSGVDVGIVGRWDEVLPRLEAAIAALRPAA